MLFTYHPMNPKTKKKYNKRNPAFAPNLGHPIHNEPAFIIEDGTNSEGNILILADLHYGIEYTLEKAGARLPSQTERITGRIIKLCSKYDVSELILLGDIKHTVPMTSRQEWYELPRVFSQLGEVVNAIEIIPGNHDGNLKKLIPPNLKNIQIHPHAGVVLHTIGLFHGHTWPAVEVLQCSQILMAHNHPNVLFVDKLGGRVSHSCWIRCRLDQEMIKNQYPELNSYDPEIIIMPAFNDLGSGTPVNSATPEFLGPLLKNKCIDLNSAQVYLLDGTDLGKLQELIDLSSTLK